MKTLTVDTDETQETLTSLCLQELVSLALELQSCHLFSFISVFTLFLTHAVFSLSYEYKFAMEIRRKHPK